MEIEETTHFPLAFLVLQNTGWKVQIGRREKKTFSTVIIKIY